MSAEEQLAAMDDDTFDSIAYEREAWRFTLTAEEYAEAQHVARRGGHFAPRDATLIARALLQADAEIVRLRRVHDAARAYQLARAGGTPQEERDMWLRLDVAIVDFG